MLSGLFIIVAPGSVVVLSGLFIIVPFPGLGETIVSHGGSMVVHSSFVPLDPSAVSYTHLTLPTKRIV